MQQKLYIATLAIGLNAASSMSAQEFDPLAEYIAAHANDHQVLADLICEQARGHKYIFLGDTDHGSTRIKDAANSPAVLKAIMDCTPGVIILEGSADDGERNKNYAISKYNIWMNDYLSHNQNYQDFIEQDQSSDPAGKRNVGIERYLESKAQQARGAVEKAFGSAKPYLLQQEFGAATYFYDQGYNLSLSDRKSIETAWKTFDLPPSCSEIALMHFAQEATDTPGEIYSAVDRLIINRLTTDNIAIADGILNSHPEGAVIIYGAGHMDQSNDLDEMVGLDHSVVIDLVDTNFSDAPKYLTKGFQRLYPLSSPFTGEPSDPADITYDVIEQIYEVKNAGNVGAEEPRPPIPRDSFEACRNLLTETARNAFINKLGVDLTYEDYISIADPDSEVPELFESWLPQLSEPEPSAPPPPWFTPPALPSR